MPRRKKLMGSPIGNYIHYHYENYLNYGIGTRGSPNKNYSAASAYITQKKRIHKEARELNKNKDKEQLKAELENILNFFRPGQKMPSGDWTEEDLNQIESAIQAAVINRINGEVIVDWDTMTALNSDYLSQIELTEGQNLRKNLSTGGMNNINSINKRIEILNRTLNETFAFVQNKKANELRKELSEIEKQWEVIQKSIDPENDIRVQNRFRKYQGIESSKMLISEALGGENGFAAQLNALWNSFKKRINAYASGEIGEYYAAIAVQAAKLKGQKITEDLKQEFINNINKMTEKELGLAGKQRSSVAMSVQNVIGGNAGNRPDHVINGLFTDFIGGQMRLTSTQDKVDLNIQLEGLDTPIAASIKNYSRIGEMGVHVHSGVSILSLTQEYTDFMNHYLNVSVRATGSSQDYSSANAILPKMNETLKLTMALKAIAGGILKLGKGGFGPSQQAEVFILNDSSGYYSVYFVDDLLDQIMKNINKYVKIDGIESDTTWKQIWVASQNNKKDYGAAYSRILGVLNQLHRFKLSISLLPTLFDTM